MAKMAAPGPRSAQNRAESGYECEFVTSSHDYLQTECSVCLQVLRFPHITSCCGHNFCKDCIERVQKDGKTCPLCNANSFTLTYNRTHDVSLQQLEVYCTHRKVGCEWSGKLEVLGKHLNAIPQHQKQLEGCGYVELQCCHDGCGQSLQRRLIAKHQSEECPQRPFTCEHCRSYKATLHILTTNHWPVCKSYPRSCPNKCTQNTIQRQNIEQHLSKDCPLQEIECEFKHAGCETKLPRKDMPGHLKDNMIGHMSLLALQIQELRATNQKLVTMNLETMAKLENIDHRVQITPVCPTVPVQIVMTNFEQHKRRKDAWYSEGFYTHQRGYKMCLCVTANGAGSGRDTHVSCFIYLMQGEFDNRLKWPFRGAITIQLLNQRENNNHHTVALNFNKRTPAGYTARVISSERSGVGWGYGKFIPHSNLGHIATTNCQYVLNDCLYFRVNYSRT